MPPASQKGGISVYLTAQQTHENREGKSRAASYPIGDEQSAPVSPASLSLRLMNLLPPPASTASHTPIAVTATTSDASICHFIISAGRPPTSPSVGGVERTRELLEGQERAKNSNQQQHQSTTTRQQRVRGGAKPGTAGAWACGRAVRVVPGYFKRALLLVLGRAAVAIKVPPGRERSGLVAV